MEDAPKDDAASLSGEVHQIPEIHAAPQAFLPVSKIVYGLMFVGLLLRVWFALITQNVDHPDEIFQYLEPAHRLVFGYGFTTWEFRFGARSWLIPLFVSIPLYLCQLLHLSGPAFYIPAVKVVFCLVSTSLIFSSYTIARNIFSERAGLIAAVLATFWYELIYFAFRPLADVQSTYFLVLAMAFLVDRNKRGRPYLFALCAGLSTILRMQYAPVLALMLLLTFFRWPRIRSFICVGIYAVVLLLAGLLDYITWGSFFASYSNTILFMAMRDVGVLFGPSRPLFWHIERLLSTSGGLLLAAFAVSCYFFRRFWLPTTAIAVVLVLHSFSPSKEYRYIFAAVPLMLIVAAMLFDFWLTKNPGLNKSKTPLISGFVALLAVSFAGYENLLPNENTTFPFTPLSQNQPYFKAFQYLSGQQDLAALLIDGRAIYQCGGYYYLHRDVPIYRALVEFQTCDQALPCISHMLSPEAGICPGLARVESFGPIVLAKGIKPSYSKVPNWTKNIWLPAIDDKYPVTVHPLLH
jgi:phosphatidylinositol glycan class B